MAPELSEKEKPEKAPEENPSRRPSTHGNSTTSTISPPSARGEKSAVQPETDLSKLDSKAVTVEKEPNADPFQHLPENEASILRKRKCNLQVLTIQQS
jgi:hypothetical protein